MLTRGLQGRSRDGFTREGVVEERKRQSKGLDLGQVMFDSSGSQGQEIGRNMIQDLNSTSLHGIDRIPGCRND